MNIKKVYKELNNPPATADKAWYRQRGYEFEKLITTMLNEENLEPRTSYKVLGEQIDGSFIYGDKVFLLEAKWHKKEMPASQIYEFKGKVDGKLVGTIGIFISMSGFSSDAVDALMYGKDINILLFDKTDFEASIDSEIGFRKVLSSKIRNAAEAGTAFYPFTRVNIVSENPPIDNSVDVEIKKYAFDLTDNKLLVANTENINYGDLVIICEGKTDQYILSRISEEILSERSMQKKISIITAMGKYAIAKITSSIIINLEDTKLLMIADSDGDEEQSKYRFKQLVDFKENELILINDSIEDWLNIGNKEDIKQYRHFNREKKYSTLNLLLEKLDYNKLRNEHKSFEKFYNIISGL